MDDDQGIRLWMKTTAMIVVVLIGLSAVAISSDVTLAQQVSPGEVLAHFCKMDSEGKRLNLEHGKEAKSLQSRDGSSAGAPNLEIIASVSLRGPDIEGNRAQFVADYNVWGRLDPSLHFVFLGGSGIHQPTLISERISLVRFDRQLDTGGDGRRQEVFEGGEWKIDKISAVPHVSVETAIRYVREQRNRSRDPLVRRNADRTIAELTMLSHTASRQIGAPRQSPATVLSQLAALQADGRGLTAEGWKELQPLFVRPSAWQLGKVHIVRDYIIGNAPYEGGRAALSVEYTALGELDSLLHFGMRSGGPIKTREEYMLVLTGDTVASRANQGPAREIIGYKTWKIESAHPEQWITVDAAIRYVTQMRDATPEPLIRKNADRTLAILNRYR